MQTVAFSFFYWRLEQGMVVDLVNGTRIDLKQLAREERVSYSTAYRWALRG